MDGLKQCPFCGGQADISVDHEAVKDTEGRRWAYTIVCNRCGATSGLTYLPQKAREVWNRRCRNDAPIPDEYNPAELHIGDRVWKKVVSIVDKKYAEAKKLPFVRNPLAWALYRTWKEFDDGKCYD